MTRIWSRWDTNGWGNKKNMKKLPVGYSNKNFFQDKFYQLKILTGKNFDILVLSYWNKNWFKISKLSVSDRGVFNAEAATRGVL